MEHYNFTELEKIMIAEDEGKYTLYKCPEHSIYMKYKGTSSSKCPFCDKSHDPIQGVRELRKKFRKELNIE